VVKAVRQQGGGHQEIGGLGELGGQVDGHGQPLLLSQQGLSFRLPLGLGLCNGGRGALRRRSGTHILLHDTAIEIALAAVEESPIASLFPGHLVQTVLPGLPLPFLQRNGEGSSDLQQS
jgi:hypothetical protein